MHTLKTAVGVFFGVLAALLAYDAITEYRLTNPKLAQQLGLKADIVQARFGNEPQVRADLARMQALAGATQPRPAGTIEWSGQPDTRVVIPRTAPAENLRGDR